MPLIMPASAQAQIDDVGVWFGITLQTKITRELEGSLTEQVRLNNDASRLNQFLSDIGINYSVNNKLKVGFHYRFIKSNQENYYSSRHRLYADISWKEKISLVSFTLRERIQEQFTDYYSSEVGKIPVWVLRSKLTAKFDLNKKYSPYLSGEIYYLLDNEIAAFGLTRYRYETGKGRSREGRVKEKSRVVIVLTDDHGNGGSCGRGGDSNPRLRIRSISVVRLTRNNSAASVLFPRVRASACKMNSFSSSCNRLSRSTPSTGSAREEKNEFSCRPLSQ